MKRRYGHELYPLNKRLNKAAKIRRAERIRKRKGHRIVVEQ